MPPRQVAQAFLKRSSDACGAAGGKKAKQTHTQHNEGGAKGTTPPPPGNLQVLAVLDGGREETKMEIGDGSRSPPSCFVGRNSCWWW